MYKSRKHGFSGPGAVLAIRYAPLVLLVLLRVAPGIPTSVAYAALAAFALTSRQNAILSLVLSWLFTLINPGLVGEIGVSGSSGGVARYYVLISVLVSVMLHSLRSKLSKLNWFLVATIFLGIFFVAHSFFLSEIVDVSILKAVSWSAAVIASILAWTGLSNESRYQTSEMVFMVLVAVAITSLPLLFTPLGYLVNRVGFQGVLNHPQAFGVTMATFVSWSAARLLSQERPGWNIIGITGLGVVLIFLSQARTAALALFTGFVVATLIVVLFSGQRFAKIIPGFGSSRVWSLVGLSLLAMLGFIQNIVAFVQEFITKNNRPTGSGLVDIYNASRGFLIDAMMANIARDPWRGVGFGIASSPSEMVIKRDPIFGLPTGAAIEKGLAPLAILEETGIVGFALAMLWVLWLIIACARGGLAPLAICMTILALNFGENTLFSTGGAGLLSVVLLGLAYTHRQSDQRRPKALAAKPRPFALRRWANQPHYQSIGSSGEAPTSNRTTGGEGHSSE